MKSGLCPGKSPKVIEKQANINGCHGFELFTCFSLYNTLSLFFGILNLLSAGLTVYSVYLTETSDVKRGQNLQAEARATRPRPISGG